MFSRDEHAKSPSWKKGRACLNSTLVRVLFCPSSDVHSAAISDIGLFYGDEIRR